MDFDKMVENYLKRGSFSKTEGRYYPSEIGSCMRKVWYSYKHPQEVKPDLLKIFHVGNIMHEFVVNVLKSEKNPHVELLEKEVPVKIDCPSFTISGRIDDIILLRIDGRVFLVEVKSHKDIRFLKKPNKTHIAQLQFYMHASGVKNGLLLYINKSDLKTKVFEFAYDEEETKKILNRFDLLHSFLTKNELPQAEALESEAWMCDYCEYKGRCDKNEL